ncbi:MAG TPA: M23 family metallopeptidase [Bacillota bacterium]|nr:M23 family metallopeptidase [Bacillota bacterium]
MKRAFGRSLRTIGRNNPGRRYGVKSVKDKSRLRSNIRNLTICIVVVLIILLLKNMTFSYAQRATAGIKAIITREYDIGERISSLKGAIPTLRRSILRVFNDDIPSGPMEMPVEGVITSGYGMRTHPVFNVELRHEGIDISAPPGEPVRAALAGVVIEAGSHPQFGNIVIIEHNTDLKTLYGHLDNIRVKENQEVSQGEIIGQLGSTGISTGPHLHFEVWRNGRPVDPVNELNPGLKDT